MTDVVTFSTLRFAVHQDLGWVSAYGISSVATGPDPARWALLAESTGAYLRSDGADVSRMLGAWTYALDNTNLGQQRRVMDVLTNQGALWHDQVWGSTFTASDSVLVSWPFPSINRSGVVGVRELINDRVLRHLTVEVGIPLTTVGGARTYDLSAWRALLDRQERVDGLVLLEPARAVGALQLPSTKRYRIYFSNGAPQLQLLDSGFGEDDRPSSSGRAFGLRGMFPARAWIDAAVSSNGFVADTDESPIGVEDVVIAARPFAFDAIARGQVPGFSDQERAVYRERYPDALRDARALPSWDHVVDRLPDRVEPAREAA